MLKVNRNNGLRFEVRETMHRLGMKDCVNNNFRDLVINDEKLYNLLFIQ